MKLEGWKLMEAAMNRRLAREQWKDAEEYAAEPGRHEAIENVDGDTK